MKRVRTSWVNVRRLYEGIAPVIKLIGIFLLVLMPSCASTHQSIRPGPEAGLLGDIAINEDAGRGSLVIVMVRLSNGDQLPFVVDTGSPFTLFDKSLESSLGNPLGTAAVSNFTTKQAGNIYLVPPIYLENIPLKIDGKYVISFDLKTVALKARRPIKGILGMDCLMNYCVQFDFKKARMRVFAARTLDVSHLGTPYKLIFSHEGQSEDENVRPVIYGDNFTGHGVVKLLVDTGYRTDGAMGSELARTLELNGMAVDSGDQHIWIRKCKWNGQTYKNLSFGDSGGDALVGNSGGLLGLRFLARHLVTLDFPNRKMYLKQTSIEPLADGKN